ncbi:bifunctional tRNA (5-methylaminomethyl-2-thiouridine)(34)-methyltransferase MnmD/FAD-dependent 5-carboxymethylaminomethyl-2-thiouridine(34) oxidoreductase MnmC [Pokkaliibacter sp. CJK22405]|uniref:bifunctional tRNA (5-methylaminomethyl-2-thiouridine)(34)-methyltransferase MnmD/FAD-dependent 5-carboxymethylaminomethyl-2-thiouridine(34) oxidoreductase MnmC n=1 Tax=Pokkaliibacter sp. CJK22405 TaxID=3384615 RepID=UPI003984BBBD
MADHSAPLTHASLQWDEQGQPESGLFQDVYFSRENGLEETHYVFLEHNDLPERWHKMADHEHFTIAETGFGTGLNFLCAWKSFLETAPETARLHFLSVEKFPLTRSDLEKALSLWPELAEQAKELIHQYPPAVGGFHRLRFNSGRVQLTLMLGDVLECYPELEAQVDAWFLDGFSPATNPEMWTQPLFDTLASLSHEQTTLATFTAAGFVRRGLIASGFAMERCKGYGRKREMMQGKFIGTAAASAPKRQSIKPRNIAVIGAGIAGASVAHALAERGHNIQVFDKASSVAAGASGNAQGLLYLKLPKQPTALSQWHIAGQLYSGRLLQTLLANSEGKDWEIKGAIQLPANQKDAERQQSGSAHSLPDSFVIAKGADELSQVAAIPVQEPGLFFPSSGWVHPPALCKTLLEHPAISLRLDTPIFQLQSQKSGWSLQITAGETFHFDDVILACGHEVQQLLPDEKLHTNEVRGQVSLLNADSLPQLEVPISQRGYIAPPRQGLYCFGATFDREDNDKNVRHESHEENLAHLLQIFPSGWEPAKEQIVGGRVSFRCTTPGHLPYVTALKRLEADRNCAQSKEINKVEDRCNEPHVLYLTVGHGSKGLITAPLAGELLACQISKEPLPLPKVLLDAVKAQHCK